jgi:hypothetical protein
MVKQMSVDSWDATGRASAAAAAQMAHSPPNAMSVLGSQLFPKVLAAMQEEGGPQSASSLFGGFTYFDAPPSF